MAREVEVKTPLYTAVFSNRGSVLTSLKLQRHLDAQGQPLELVVAEASERLGRWPFQVGPLATGPSVPEGRGLATALFRVTGPGLELAQTDRGSLEFEWSDGQGTVCTKRFDFAGDSYLLGVEASLREKGTEVGKTLWVGPGLGAEAATGAYVQAEKGVIKTGRELRLLAADDLEEAGSAAVDVRAVGVSAHYFAALLLAEPGGAYAARLTRATLEVGEEKKKRDFIGAAIEVSGREPARFSLFIGPKDRELLVGLGDGMEGVIEYGDWMRYLVMPLRVALLWMNERVGNFGWSIVLLTVLINLGLSPLKHHSYVSMRKMQKLAPQVKRIQERFKKLKATDPRRREMNVEVMAVYKENKVSPLSGCLPMLLMIPFFFAFYRLLSVSVELRHAPYLWVSDLSTHDPLFILPILMGVSQLAIQKMTPQTSADPVQAKIMMVMPVVFVFFLAWAPAGLVLYWFANNLVSMAQQMVTNRWLIAEEEQTSPSRARGRDKSVRQA
jgi:YidC/Oxa1 family membrane protein insertase